MPLLTSLSRDQIPSDLHDLWDQCDGRASARISAPLEHDGPFSGDFPSHLGRPAGTETRQPGGGASFRARCGHGINANGL
jgi:hypothetical protein